MKKTKLKKTKTPELEFHAWESAAKIARRLQVFYNTEMTRHNETLYGMLAGALVVREKYEDDEEWQTLCDEPYWEEREPRYRPNADTNSPMRSHFTGLFLFAGKKFVRINRAQKYGRILDHYFNLGIDPVKLKAKISADGGIEAVLKKVAEGDPRYKKLDVEELPEPQAKDIYGDDLVADDGNDDEENDEDEQKNSSSVKEQNSQKSKKNPYRLGVDLTKEEFERAMKRPIGKKIRIVAVREAGQGAYKPYRATKFGLYPKKK
ncbi:hypothetical protein [Methylobacterium sp. SI9]|uniref:hypothetical protein n=1 Tax=Methylobacterium guangdongense TaxID=3138811 RepID=UPI00313C8BF8